MARILENQGLYESRREHGACGIGAVVNISGQRSHSIIEHGKEILLNLRHRGAASADEITGDGAGILFQIPHKFFQEECSRLGITLPAIPLIEDCQFPIESAIRPADEDRKSKIQTYGVGMVFGPQDNLIEDCQLPIEDLKSKIHGLGAKCDKVLEDSINYYGMKVLGWRNVPTSNDCLGPIALEAEPAIKQVFVDGAGLEGEQLERKLYLARKRAEKTVRKQFGQQGEDFYVASLSSRTICYKGMFMAWQLFAYYPDLADERVASALAIVHQRYSTNTFPNWHLARPSITGKQKAWTSPGYSTSRRTPK